VKVAEGALYLETILADRIAMRTAQ
jgi:hypothetical protein